jgi:hypothetical protein
MANFYFTATPQLVSANGNPWVDPVTALPNPYYNPLAPPTPPALDNQPTFQISSRQNAVNGIPHRYNKFKRNVQINVLLNPLGTTGLVLDATLGSNLFQASFAENPLGMFAWSSVLGASAFQFFMPTVVGNYCAVFGRTNSVGGRIIWHFSVEP